MTDIRQLIQKTIELEGILKVLLDRDDRHAMELLVDKYKDFCTLMDDYAADASGSDPHLLEVKDDEAEEVQVEPENDAAEKAVEHEEEMPKPDFVSVAEPEPEPECEPEQSQPYDELAVLHITHGQHERNTALLRAFTLNDKFRYIREVFGGDERDFNDTLSLIADMCSYSEAEEYITGDMMLDKENPGVADFLEFISPYMKH